MGTPWLFTLMFLILPVHPLYIGLRCTNHFSSSSLLKCQLLLSVEGRGGSRRGWAHLQAPGSLASSWNVVIYHYWFLIVDPNKSTDFLARCMATFSHVVLFFSVNRGIEHDYLQRVLDKNTAQGKVDFISHTWERDWVPWRPMVFRKNYTDSVFVLTEFRKSGHEWLRFAEKSRQWVLADWKQVCSRQIVVWNSQECQWPLGEQAGKIPCGPVVRMRCATLIAVPGFHSWLGN